MPDIDSNAYKALKKLGSIPDSRDFNSTEKYWTSYLIKRNLAQSSSYKTDRGVVMTEVITEQGKSFIRDQKHKTFMLWLRWSLTTFIAIGGLTVMVITLLLTLKLLQQ